MRNLSIIAVAMIAGVAPAAASTLRTTTTLSAPVVMLSDLFDDAGPQASRVLGAAPAPGTRIVVGSRQLAAIAREFGVDWRPSSSADRIVLERPGRVLPREAIVAPLRAALVDAGAPPGADVEIPGFVAPIVATGALPDVAIEQLDYDAATERFSAGLILTAPGVETERLRLTGEAIEMIDSVVAARPLKAGTVIGAEDVRVARIRAASLHAEAPHSVDEVIGRALRIAAFPGTPILAGALVRPDTVQRNEVVAIEVHAPGLDITMDGVAQGSGTLGDIIPVLNSNSRAILSAEIIAPGRVRVAPGSFPRRPPGDAARVAAR